MRRADGSVRTIAEGFEADRETAKGPNDITVSDSGIVYFTDPDGYYGESEPGTVYRIDAEGAVHVFDASVVGPNGIVLSADDRGLYVASNVAESVSNLLRWPLAEDGSAAGAKQVVVRVEPCVADGMAVDAQGMVWPACYPYGTAHRIDTTSGETVELVTTERKALTNAVFGRGEDATSLHLGHGAGHWLRISREGGNTGRALIGARGLICWEACSASFPRGWPGCAPVS